MSAENTNAPIDPLVEIVEKYYEMDPETEDLCLGTNLTVGMEVLIEEPHQRINKDDLEELPQDSMFELLLTEARKTNRWCVITEITWQAGMVSFIGLYHDRVKRHRHYKNTIAWIVKKDSVASRDQIQEAILKRQGEMFMGVKKSVPNGTLGKTQVAHPRSEQTIDEWKESVVWSDRPLAGAVKSPEYLVDPNPNADGSTGPWKDDGTWADWARGAATENEVIDRKLAELFPEDKRPSSPVLAVVWDKQRRDYVDQLRKILSRESSQGALVSAVLGPNNGFYTKDELVRRMAEDGCISDATANNFLRREKED